MNGFGNKAWRRAGLTVPDTRTEQRIEVVGQLRFKEWRKETPLRVKTAAPLTGYAYALWGEGLLRNTCEAMYSDEGNEQTVECWQHNEWQPIRTCWCTLCVDNITEAEARAQFPYAFVPEYRYFVCLNDTIRRYRGDVGEYYSRSGIHRWTYSSISITAIVRCGHVEITEAEARTRYPNIFQS